MLWRLRNIWRIVREADLEAIREVAEAPVRVTILADEPDEAGQLAALLGGEEWRRNPTLEIADLSVNDNLPRAGQAVEPGDDAGEGFGIVVLVGREPGLSPALAATRRDLAAARTPAFTVITGTTPEDAPWLAGDERSRVAVRQLDRSARETIVRGLFDVVFPDVRIALARRLPLLRPILFTVLTEETARANAGYSLSTGLAESIPGLAVPAVIGDIIILTKNQIIMAYRIALAAGKQGEPRQLVGEIIGVLGGALLFRQIARELVGLVPVIGIVPKVAVAYGGTWAIGQAVAVWASNGTRLTRGALRDLFRRGLERGRQATAALPDKTSES